MKGLVRRPLLLRAGLPPPPLKSGPATKCVAGALLSLLQLSLFLVLVYRINLPNIPVARRRCSSGSCGPMGPCCADVPDGPTAARRRLPTHTCTDTRSLFKAIHNMTYIMNFYTTCAFLITELILCLVRDK